MDELAALLATSAYNNTSKCLIILDKLGGVATARQIRETAYAHGLRAAAKWNIGALLRNVSGRAALTSAGWKLLPEGHKYLAIAGYSSDAGGISTVVSPLRDLAERVKTPQFKSYLLEAVNCFDGKCYRAAVIMSWCAAIEALRVFLANGKFSDCKRAFDAQFPTRAGELRNPRDFEKLKESEFILVLEKASLIGKTLKKQLEQRLDLRNAVGHPSDVSVSKMQAAAHLEFLFDNVFQPHAV